jgi:hypothetical protein
MMQVSKDHKKIVIATFLWIHFICFAVNLIMILSGSFYFIRSSESRGNLKTPQQPKSIS